MSDTEPSTYFKGRVEHYFKDELIVGMSCESDDAELIVDSLDTSPRTRGVSQTYTFHLQNPIEGCSTVRIRGALEIHRVSAPGSEPLVCVLSPKEGALVSLYDASLAEVRMYVVTADGAAKPWGSPKTVEKHKAKANVSTNAVQIAQESPKRAPRRVPRPKNVSVAEVLKNASQNAGKIAPAPAPAPAPVPVPQPAPQPAPAAITTGEVITPLEFASCVLALAKTLRANGGEHDVWTLIPRLDTLYWDFCRVEGVALRALRKSAPSHPLSISSICTGVASCMQRNGYASY